MALICIHDHRSTRKPSKKLSYIRKSKLTDGQNKALMHLLGSIKAGETAALHGAAGTGKTFLTKYLLNELKSWGPHWGVQACSPTHKAASVLRQVLGDSVNVCTIARLLKMKPSLRGNQRIFRPDRYAKGDAFAPNIKVLLIDESSMISAEIGNAIEKTCREEGVVPLFIGDPSQLPPIETLPDENEDEKPCSQFLNPVGGIAKLTDVVRHQGPVLQFATAIRNAEKPSLFLQQQWPSVQTKDKQSAISVYDTQSAWLDAAAAAIATEEWNNNPDCARVLTFSNKQCHSLGAALRSRKIGSSATQWQAGEIISNGESISQPGESLGRPLAPAAMEWRILQSETIVLNQDCGGIHWYTPQRKEPRLLKLSAKAEVASLLIKPLHEDRTPIQIYCEQPGQSDWSSQMKEISKAINYCSGQLSPDKRSAAWREWHYLKSFVADIRYGAVMTVHRSQGSTFEQVWIGPDLAWSLNKDVARQLHYVAVTRCSKHLHVLKR